MMEVICNDRMGGKVRVKCFPIDTVLIVKKLIAAHTGTRCEKIKLQKAHVVFKDHIEIQDYEI
jgi:ubiquitin-like protein 5